MWLGGAGVAGVQVTGRLEKVVVEGGVGDWWLATVDIGEASQHCARYLV